MAIKRTKMTLIGLLVLESWLGSPTIGAAQAATGDCQHNAYRISSPAKYRDTDGTTVVIGLKAPMRTVTFVTAGSGCVLEIGDHWSVFGGPNRTRNHAFLAEGTYDGTAASLTDRVRVKVPTATYSAAGRVRMTLDDITGADNDIISSRSIRIKRRTAWRGFNVFPESPTPACGSLTGTTLHAEGRLFHVVWSANTYHQYKDRKVRLMFKPGNGPIAPGQTGAITIAKDVTNANGWARFTFKPQSAGTYFVHYGGNGRAGNSDSPVDFVNCAG